MTEYPLNGERYSQNASSVKRVTDQDEKETIASSMSTTERRKTVKDAERSLPKLDDALQYEVSHVDVFLYMCAFASIVALIGGSLLDNGLSKVQGAENDEFGDALLFFSIQLAANVLLILILSQLMPSFIPWCQSTPSGVFGSVLFFAVQANFTRNTLRITKF